MNVARLSAVVGALLLFGAGGNAFGSLIYATGFEAPTFQLGPLSGQGGWLAAPNVTVQNSPVPGGGQAVIFENGSGLEAVNPTPVDTTKSQFVLMLEDFGIADLAGTAPYFALGALTPSFDILGGVVINPDGSLVVLSPAYPTTVPGVFVDNAVNSVAFLFDFHADTYSVFVNSNLVAGNEPFAETSNTQFLGGAVGQLGSGGAALLDNYAVVASDPVVASVPEPATAGTALAALALAACGVRRKRR